MTTIAVRDGVIAADSNLACGDTRAAPGAISKLTLGKRHRAIYGGAGVFAVTVAAIRRLERMKTLPWHGKSRECDLSLGESVMVVLTPEGVFTFEGGGWFQINDGVFYASGTGETAALAAMWCGKTAVQAVEIACKVDTGSCLPVHAFSLRDIHAR